MRQVMSGGRENNHMGHHSSQPESTATSTNVSSRAISASSAGTTMTVNSREGSLAAASPFHSDTASTTST